MPRRVVPVLLLLAAVLLFWRGVLFRPGVSVPWDFRGHHLPLAAAYADALHEGELPLWDPYTYCGRPLLANPQTAVFYPGMFLTALGSRDGLLQRLEWLLVLHVFLAGWFAWLLARRIGLSQEAALLAGMIFALGGWLASQAEHLSSILGAPWLVACWLALYLPTRWRVPLLATALSLHFFAGFTASTLTAGASTLMLALLRMKEDRRLPLQVLLGAALAVACSGVQLLPSLELVGQSVGQYRSEWLKGGGGMPPLALLSLVWPRVVGPYEPTLLYLFASVTGLLLALAAVLRARLWAGLALACGLLMLGEYTPLGRGLFALLPAFLRNTVYWYLFAAPFLLALALLAARGADSLLRRPSWRWAAALLAAAELIAAGSGRVFNTQPVAAEPMATGEALDGSREALGQLAGVTAGGRYDTNNDAVWLVTGAPLLRLRTAGGYDPLALARVIQVRLGFAKGERWGAWYQVERPDAPVARLMGIRALLRPGAPVSFNGWRPAAALPGRTLYESASALPRYRLVARIRPANSMTEAAALLGDPTFVPEEEAIVENLPAQQGSGGTVRVMKESRHRVELDTDSAGASYLTTSESHYPGWTAEVDGRPANLYYSNVAFRGLPIPAGRHHVVMAFTTPRLRAGLLLSAAGLAVLMFLSLLAWQNARRLY